MRALKDTDDKADSWLPWPRRGKRDRPDGSMKLHGTRQSTRSRPRPKRLAPSSGTRSDRPSSPGFSEPSWRTRLLTSRNWSKSLGGLKFWPTCGGEILWPRHGCVACARRSTCSKRKGAWSREGNLRRPLASRVKPWTSAARRQTDRHRPWQTRLCLPGLANWSERDGCGPCRVGRGTIPGHRRSSCSAPIPG